MPEMDGLETTLRVRHNLLLTNIPIIALTGLTLWRAISKHSSLRLSV
ncbi:MAG: hypothetical protein K2Q13_04725 [Nitrosomonas sp.]|nr:hypothetical protein [Nitrosomonas sp.]MBY0474354.1 hypothetical protein [Nitrosomonas sp.]